MNVGARTGLAIGLGTALAALPSLGLAQQAVVRSYDAAGLELGQAWLMHSAGRCYALLPHHVAQETSVASLLREGARGLRGEAMSVADLGDDAAIALLSGAIAQDCGYSIGSVPRSVDRRLRDGGLGTLRYVNGDGSLGRLAVTVVDDDGVRYLRIRPSTDGDRIRKGHSGSLLLLGDQPVGMLLSVSARSGVGTVLRTDALLGKVDAHVRTAAATANPTGTIGNSTAASKAVAAPTENGWHVTGWNVDPISSDHLASQLTAGDGDGHWAARVGQWPAVVELGGLDAVRIVYGVEFLAAEAGDAATLPARVQVMTSVNAERPSWRAVATGTLDYVDGVARLAFPPTRARMLRVEIHGTQSAAGQVALGRLRVLEGNP